MRRGGEEVLQALEALHRDILNCQRCGLARSRSRAVPGEGPHNAALVIVGEAPGRQEDLEGRPFVGSAGRLLTRLLQGAGIDRSSVFITNVVKCRPPGNRPPNRAEREACYPYLKKQLELINPHVVCLAGRVPVEVLLGGRVSITAMHGKAYQREGRTYFVMYHPAAGLYTQRLVPVMEEDARRLQALLAEKLKPKTRQQGQLHLTSFFEE